MVLGRWNSGVSDTPVVVECYRASLGGPWWFSGVGIISRLRCIFLKFLVAHKACMAFRPFETGVSDTAVFVGGPGRPWVIGCSRVVSGRWNSGI